MIPKCKLCEAEPLKTTLSETIADSPPEDVDYYSCINNLCNQARSYLLEEEWVKLNEPHWVDFDEFTQGLRYREFRAQIKRYSEMLEAYRAEASPKLIRAIEG